MTAAVRATTYNEHIMLTETNPIPNRAADCPGLMGEAEPPTTTADRDLIEHHVARVIVKPQALDVCLIPASEASAQTEEPSLQDPAPRRPLATTITLAWTAPSFAAVKGIVGPQAITLARRKLLRQLRSRDIKPTLRASRPEVLNGRRP
jgi:hypothetical protein